MQRAGKNLAHALARVERGVGMLEDDLHVAPVVAVHAGDVVNAVAAEDDLAIERIEAGQRLGERRFARAGFADDAEDFTGLDGRLMARAPVTFFCSRPSRLESSDLRP